MKSFPSILQAFCDPVTHEALAPNAAGLSNRSNLTFEFLDHEMRVVDFMAPSMISAADDVNLQMYNDEHSTDKYRNFLNWLFATFNTQEDDFRADLVRRVNLSEGMKVLVVGCGLGEDIPLILKAIGPRGELHAQDISKSMIKNASDVLKSENVCFSISNATQLPYQSRYFDVVFHFGGINLFGDMKKAIAELERVCKVGGQVMFGDEGIAPHLRGTQFADVLINNNGLWALHAPVESLPHNAEDIVVSYVLGNCFYLISFSPAEGLPQVDLDVPHIGTRGGSARTRYFGKIEGVTEKTKLKLVAAAKQRGVSAHDLLEEIINAHTASDDGKLG
ncbi:class I SAM-dependent methyltransferase [Variovorax sp. M-6]|uniref:class I SAM-dependent methyltransferase n=1 Tax=Variovorax sp. M-6 TaxID=3233041 RepID=UPI003F9793A7